MLEYIHLDYDIGRRKAVIKCGNRLFAAIRDHYSVPNPQAKAMRRFGNVRVPLFKYVITPTGRYDIGLTGDIFKWLSDRKVEYTVETTDKFREAYNSRFDFDYHKGENIFELKLKLRDYQKIGVETVLDKGNGVFVYPTSAGKTLTIATSITNILSRKPDAKILVVTLTHLVSQFYSDFVNDYGMDASKVSMWTGENKFVETPVVIAGNSIVCTQLKNVDKEIIKLKNLIEALSGKTDKKSIAASKAATEEVERLRNRLSENRMMRKYFESVYALFVDEVHQCKSGNSITDIFDYIQTKHTFGFTGTLPNDKIDEWTVLGLVGPVRQIVERDKLVKDGRITDVYVQFIDLRYLNRPQYITLDSPTSMLENFRIESEFLYSSNFRNMVITKIAIGTPKNILILVDRIEHGETLKDLISKAAPNKYVTFINGEVEDDDREHIKVLMETNDNVVCIAITKIFSTGVNIKNIHYLMFANAWKTRVSIIQSIGRGVRMMENKNRVVLFDIHDCLKYGEKHYIERRKIYENEHFKCGNKEFDETK